MYVCICVCVGGVLLALLACIKISFYCKQICHVCVIKKKCRTAKTFNYLQKTFVINVLMKEPYVFSLTVMLLNDYLVTGE